jgi:alpha-beta hydrolase superfamily lysophospholipase
MTIQTDEGALAQRSPPGPTLYFNATMPAGAPKAMLALLHGYADHGARYLHVMGALAEHGIGSVAVDMRGHGRASGPRGHCDRFAEFLDDAGELARLASDRAKGAPLFLFGHSFGGLVASASAIDAPRAWRGLVLSAPFFGLALEVPAIKVGAAKLASRLVPRLALPSGLSGKDVTHDAARARAYDEDPLVFKKATARWFVETQAAQARTIARAPELRMPLYVVFGGADPIAKLASGRAFFDRVGSSDKTFDERSGLFHEVLNEPVWKEITERIAKWILERAA